MIVYKIVEIECSGKYSTLKLESRSKGISEHTCKTAHLVDIYVNDEELFNRVISGGLVGLYVALDELKTLDVPAVYFERVEAIFSGPLAWHGAQYGDE